MLWSLGKLQIQSPPLLRLLSSQTEKHLADLEPRELANVLTAFARLRHLPASPRLLPALMTASRVRTGAMDIATLSGFNHRNLDLPSAKL